MNFLNPDLFILEPSYDLARENAQSIDQLLGFEVEKIEMALLELARESDPQGSHKTWGPGLHRGNQTWVGLSHQTLQTPYSEIRQMCELLNPGSGSVVVDLGAGYGRMGLVLAALYPEVNFVGYEYVPERVFEGRRILSKYGCSKASLLVEDLANEDFKLPEAEYYFLYDFGTLTHIKKILNALSVMSEKKKFKLVARGKGTRSLIQYDHPWLCEVYPPIHEENFSIYSMSQTL